MYNNGVYTATKIFTGEDWLHNHAIVVSNNCIDKILPIEQLLVPATKHFNCLIPGFIDIQIYGAQEKLFSVHPTINTLNAMYQHCLNNKTVYFLPTIATNTYEVIYSCIDAVMNYWIQGGQGCLGLHIEGPWINPAKKGAHLQSLIHSPTVKEVENLLNYGKGIIKVITLAPEVCTPAMIDLIHSYGIIISAGHSNASFEEATQFLNDGKVSTVTHLYNAMSGLEHRAPGLVGATLHHSTVKASIIPDGHHVHFAAIAIAQKIMGNRLFVITDAVTTTSSGYYQHQLEGNKYTSNGTLSGSALTMKQAVNNLVQYCNISLEEAFNMCSLYAAEAIGVENSLGKIEHGYEAAFVGWDSID